LFDLLKRELGNRTTGTNKINVVDFGRAEQVFRKYIQEVPKLNAVAPGTDGEVCDLGFRAYLRHRQFQELLDWGY
jgi:hypothetical protein